MINRSFLEKEIHSVTNNELQKPLYDMENQSITLIPFKKIEVDPPKCGYSLLLYKLILISIGILSIIDLYIAINDHLCIQNTENKDMPNLADNLIVSSVGILIWCILYFTHSYLYTSRPNNIPFCIGFVGYLLRAIMFIWVILGALLFWSEMEKIEKQCILRIYQYLYAAYILKLFLILSELGISSNQCIHM